MWKIQLVTIAGYAWVGEILKGSNKKSVGLIFYITVQSHNEFTSIHCFTVSNAEPICNQKFLYGGKILIKYNFIQSGSNKTK
jgi:hypothetical protein